MIHMALRCWLREMPFAGVSGGGVRWRETRARKGVTRELSNRFVAEGSSYFES